jgi:hypothetical protein
MALFFTGSSTCAICEEVINDTPRLSAAFLSQGHDLWQYSDACFHQKCFDEWDLRDRFLNLENRFQDMWDRRPVHLGLEVGMEWLEAELDKFAEYAKDH